jgi:membrane associated rhomboid family serine protease
LIPIKDNIRLVRWPLITIALIVANVVAYLLAIANGGSIIGGPSAQTLVRYGAIPYEFAHWGQHCALGLGALGQSVLCTGQRGVIGAVGSQPATWLTAFTATFLNVNILQLVVNMVVLAVFGATLEDSLGRPAFLAFYVLGALAALALTVAAASNSAVPTLGTPGAIAAVLGGYIVFYPRARILSVSILVFFFNLVEVPACVWLALWLLFDAGFGALGVITPLGGDAGGAYYAGFGGLAFGLLVASALMRRRSSVGPERRLGV